MNALFATASHFLLAEGWSWRGMFTGLNTQEGVVRLCIVAVALGLFIMTRK